MSEPLAFDGEELVAKVPALGEAQDQVATTTSHLDATLGSIGTLWPGGTDDDLTAQFAANYKTYEKTVDQFMGLLADGVGGATGRVATAGEAHVDGESTNVDTAKKW